MRHLPRPGGRLRAFAARVCSAKTMERLIDPLVADLQAEYVEAIRQRRVWRSRWVRVAGYAAFLKVIAFAACEGSLRALDATITGDDRTTGRVTGWTLSAIGVLTALLAIWPLLNLSWMETRLNYVDRAMLLIYLIPQALPIAVPIGLTIGILHGWTDRTVSRRSSGVVLAMAFVCSLAMFAMLAWIIPASNQAFRVTFVGHDLLKGLHELTLDDLSRQVALELPLLGDLSIRQLATEYHVRWALASASFIFALFSVAVIPRRPAGRTILGLAVCGIYFAYYITVFGGTAPLRVHVGGLPPLAIAWLPNVVMAGLSLALVTVRTRAHPAA